MGGSSLLHLRAVHCPSTLDCSWAHHREGRQDDGCAAEGRRRPIGCPGEGRGRPADGPLSETEFKGVVAAMQALHGV
jgi:hypothetical protein